MKILFLSDLLAYGGASKLIYDLLPRMAEQGNKCDLLILTDDHSKYVNDLQKKGITVNIVHKGEKGHLNKIKYIRNWVERGEYDVIHANLFPTIYYCSIVKKMLGKKCPPLVMTEHNTDNKRRHKFYLRPLEKFIYKKYDHIISISDKTQENLCNWLGTVGNKKFTVIENGIDVNAFRTAKPVEKKAICDNYEEGDILLLIVGRFSTQKNHIGLLETLAQLPKRYKLLLCGEGELEEIIRNKVKELCLENRVVFLGFRRDIAQIMHTADVLVIPSIWEGFGLIAVEGMASGIPIVAADVPGLSEVVGDSGLKVDSSDRYQMAKAIKTLEDKSYSEQLIQRANERANLFDISRMVDEHLSLYYELINSKEEKR